MSLAPEQQAELDRLLFALRDGALDDAGYASLERFVLEYGEARERFIDCLYLQATLHWKYAGPPAGEETRAGVEPPRAVSPAEPPRSRAAGIGLAWISAAVVLLAGAGVSWFLASRQQPDHDDALARITRLSDAEFDDLALSEGSALMAGSRLDLGQGLAEITFDSGARVVLEGPAVFHVLTAARGRLTAGSLTAKVPPALKGFVVETPSLTVLDLGTEFGVRANPKGVSEVHVFDGAVEAESTQGHPQTVLLRERQAIQCDSQTGALEDVIFDEERFIRDLYRLPAAAAAAPDFAETFDDLEHLQLQRGYKCADAQTSLSDNRQQGAAAVRIDWQAVPDNYGVVYLTKKVPATDISGCSFEISVKPLTPNSGYWGIELFDDRGQMVEQHRVFALKVGQWNRLAFKQGEQVRGGYFHAGPGDRTRVSKVVFLAQTREPSQTASDLWDEFQLVAPQ
jgi:ferric-dicitrate binding protein FerR (iron transport regulator)